MGAIHGGTKRNIIPDEAVFAHRGSVTDDYLEAVRQHLALNPSLELRTLAECWQREQGREERGERKLAW